MASDHLYDNGRRQLNRNGSGTHGERTLSAGPPTHEDMWPEKHLRRRQWYASGVSSALSVGRPLLRSFHRESRGQNCGSEASQNEDDEAQNLRLLLEAFPRVSVERLAKAFHVAGGDPNKAADVLSTVMEENLDDCSHTSDSRKHGSYSLDSQVKEESSDKDAFPREALNAVNLSDCSSSKMPDGHQSTDWREDFTQPPTQRDLSAESSHCERPDANSDLSMTLHFPQDFRDEAGFAALSEIELSQRRKSGLPSSAPSFANRGTSHYAQRMNTSGNASNSVAPTSQKPTAITGCVSSQMLRRIRSSSSDGTVERAGEKDLDDWLYSGKLRRKKKLDDDSGLVHITSQSSQGKDTEEFIYSMLGGELGRDIIRDVLTHYAGDLDNALETLLNIGSTSAGVQCTTDAEKVAEHGISSLECLENSQRHEDPLPRGRSTHEEDLLTRFREAFPNVDASSLAEVLQACGFSYTAAVDVMRESGMIPKSDQNLQFKVDPAEVLHALFKADPEARELPGVLHEPQVEASPFSEALVPAERWTIVTGKQRTRRSPHPDMRLVAEKLKCDAKDEYTRQRASANEHWITWKNYVKEATAAYNQGDRLRANALSNKGAEFKRLAQDASKRASQNIFNVVNKDKENIITIDLHLQHVNEALQILKLHLRSLSVVPSVSALKVITGKGIHSVGGRARIKPALTRHLDKKQIPWKEVNPGLILINLSDIRGSFSCCDATGNSSDEDVN